MTYTHAILESSKIVGDVVENETTKDRQENTDCQLHHKQLPIAKNILGCALKEGGDFIQQRSAPICQHIVVFVHGTTFFGCVEGVVCHGWHGFYPVL